MTFPRGGAEPGARCGCARSNQLSVAFLPLLLVALSSASSTADGPVGGMPFTLSMPLGTLPSSADDGMNAEMSVTRLMHAAVTTNNQPPSACDMGANADPKKCLNVERGCMWTSLTTRNPLKRIQAITSYCLPCELDNVPIPCWNPGAWTDGKQVLDCKMSCIHGQRIWQPQYGCSDTTGFISMSQCFDRAKLSRSKCMYIAYEDSAGEPRASCAPCELSGSGGWGCPVVGEAGPAAGSKVSSCLSQCDVLCAGPPACPPTVAPPPPPPPQQSPGLPDTSSPADTMVTAPVPWLPIPAPNPMAIIEAARDAAIAAGWQIAPAPPLPKVYWPVIYYRSPGDYMFTTGPPPLDGPEPPKAPSSLLQRAARASQRFLESLEASSAQAGLRTGSAGPVEQHDELPNVQRMPRQPFLKSLRLRSFGQ